MAAELPSIAAFGRVNGHSSEAKRKMEGEVYPCRRAGSSQYHGLGDLSHRELCSHIDR